MREIKFRAWDTLEHKMKNVGALTFNDEKYGIVVDDEQWDQITRPILMQYTGLKDKNGKEIYEGDIVQFSYPKQEIIKTAEVIWIDNMEFGNVCLVGFGLKFSENNSGSFPTTEVNIVGNIYENPELLSNTPQE